MKATIIDRAGYFRPLRQDDSMAEAHQEAAQHGSIVAMRGEVICIMPRLIEGWELVHGVRRKV